MKSEAWLIAIEIGARRGASIDLASPAEHDTVLAWLYKRYVDYVNGKLKESIDQKLDGAGPWHERLAAPQELDPLAQLLRYAEETADLPMKGFSQFSAYMILLKRCEMNFTKVAAYLDISFFTLRKRIEIASDHANIQPSIWMSQIVSHFPMQKLVKIRPSRSSDVNSPVISPRHCCACRSSSAISSPARRSFN